MREPVVPVPNFSWRRAAIQRHDLHHMLTGYPFTMRGEFQVATWEFAAGRYPHWGATLLLLPLVVSWLAVVMVSGFVGLSSIAAAVAVPIYLLLRDGARITPVMGFALACAVLVAYTHRGNVRRMRAGTETRARKLWLFGRGRES